ncbi:13480_t:CDS:1 [Ambispora gerdemannii]|uniref:13480_t:CDS:1 n=1 Tax=Ambispora gerdemannii TaxID=144530 RepID=A0A9N9CPL8_9GLOM|nr:13480_t:CDS:1 [Ambispora gerdemannii]
MTLTFGQIQDPREEVIPKNVGQIGQAKLKDKNPLFNTNSQWESNDRRCMDIITPPPFSVLVPYYHVWIRWNKSEECNPITPLTNFAIKLYNNPKSSGNVNNPKVKAEWDHEIAVGVQGFQIEWDVPLFPEDEVKNISLFYIRVQTEANINGGMYTVFGVTGPLTIWTKPDIVNKTLFTPEEKNHTTLTNTTTGKLVKSTSDSFVFTKPNYYEIMLNIVVFCCLIASGVALFL